MLILAVSDFAMLLFQALFEAGENRIGTVCSVLIDVLTNRSEAQLCKGKWRNQIPLQR